MRATTLSLVVWNVAFRHAESPDGHALRAAIAACEPDIVCITEGHPDFLDLPHRIRSGDDYGYPRPRDRRKVLLWSREQWRAVDALGDADMPPGRYVAGVTDTPIGEVALHGICVPWPFAHVATGRRDQRPWDEHVLYLGGLRRVLDRASAKRPTLVLGDYNQPIPQRRQPHRAYQALREAFPPSFRCATEGPIPPLGLPSIDHVSLTGGIEVVSLQALPNLAEKDRKLSDHIGLHLRLRRGGSP